MANSWREPDTILITMLLSGLIGLLLAVSAVAAPSGGSTSCSNPRIRKEWRTLRTHEKASYISAVKNCLHKKKGTYNGIIPGALTMYEDYAWVHVDQSPFVHVVGHFLPWHRLLLWNYETRLRTQCGYTGPLPYWDYTLDASNILASPLWSSTNGFGSNGQYLNPPPIPLPVPDAPAGAGGGCMPNGPFAFPGFKVHIASGPSGARVPDRCLSRNINPTIAARALTAAEVNYVLSQPDYESMHRATEGNSSWANGVGIHGGAHFAVGGENNNVYTSPLDPTFWLLHANIDRIWSHWQNVAPSTRTYQIGGPIKPWVDLFGVDYSHLPDGPVTLDFKIDLGRLQSPIPVSKVMDTKGGFLCYEYR